MLCTYSDPNEIICLFKEQFLHPAVLKHFEVCVRKLLLVDGKVISTLLEAIDWNKASWTSSQVST